MTSDQLTPRTARESALCRQACVESATIVVDSSDSATVAAFREHALAWASQRYPDPPRELRKVACEMEGLFEGTRATFLVTYEAGKFVSRFVSKNNDMPSSPEYDSVADFARGARRGLSDDTLTELLTLPADPYMPAVETNLKKEAYKLGYQNAMVNHMLYKHAEATVFVDSLSFYIPPKIEETE